MNSLVLKTLGVLAQQTLRVCVHELREFVALKIACDFDDSKNEEIPLEFLVPEMLGISRNL